MAGQAEETAYTIFVQIGRRIIVVFPDGEVDLGVVADDERVLIGEETGPGGRRRSAVKLKADDPKATLTDDSADAAASKEKTTE